MLIAVQMLYTYGMLRLHFRSIIALNKLRLDVVDTLLCDHKQYLQVQE